MSAEHSAEIARAIASASTQSVAEPWKAIVVIGVGDTRHAIIGAGSEAALAWILEHFDSFAEHFANEIEIARSRS